LELAGNNPGYNLFKEKEFIHIAIDLFLDKDYYVYGAIYII